MSNYKGDCPEGNCVLGLSRGCTNDLITNKDLAVRRKQDFNSDGLMGWEGRATDRSPVSQPTPISTSRGLRTGLLGGVLRLL